MRPNVTIYGLLACSIGASANDATKSPALRQTTGISQGTANTIVAFGQTQLPSSPDAPIISQSEPLTFRLTASRVNIHTVRLKSYSTKLDDAYDDKTLANLSFPLPSQPSDSDEENTALANERVISSRISNDGVLQPGVDGTNVTIQWNIDPKYISQPLYLECEWANLTLVGSSTSQLFAAYNPTFPDKAADNLKAAIGGGSFSDPARPEISSDLGPSPPPSTSTAATPPTSATPATSNQPVATIDLQQSTATQQGGGLSKNGIIGVAVGVTVGGLLIIGLLVWFFWFRRRRSGPSHHAMPSYSSDVGVHTMIQDKEMPAALGSTSPHLGYSAGEGRPSTEHYAPYSDRSAAPTPTPDHHRAPSAAATISQTEHSWAGNRSSAATPTNVITSRYAHLVEEGMTEDEIRRLEEEERQLDAAIENAGRRGNHPNP
ncbi:hypothetical protein F4802DRAFT_305337 [Xylaria palmicola]|nr:hypothetical protein F4802DRAFT_305337 [Xylaria palmicola]